MQLVRTNSIPKHLKKECPLPLLTNEAREGIFFALAGANDLPYGSKLISADLVQLLKHGQLWVGKAGTNPDWKEVEKASDLPKFVASGYDDYDACTSGTCVSPYMPQFFWVPRNWRGARILKRSKWGQR